MRRLLYNFFNIIFLLVIFGAFKNTPLYLLDKFLALGSAGICCFWISYNYLLGRNIYYKFSKRFLIILIPLCFLSIYLSKSNYGQTLGDSFAANIDYVSLLILIFYAYAFKFKILRVQDIESKFKWFILLDVILLYACKDLGNLHVSSLNGTHDVALRIQYFPKEFIRFGAIYCFALFLKKKKYIYIIYSGALLFYPNLLLYFERGYFAVSVTIMVMTILIIRKSRRLFRNISLSILSFFLLLIIAVNAAGPVADNIISKYGDIVSGVTTGSSEDQSVQYRIQELGGAAKLIHRNPYLGSGRLNTTTTQFVLGMDYWASDLGIIGIESAYGIPGIIIFLVIIGISISAFYKTIKNAQQFSYVTIGLAMYSLGLALISVQTAQALITPVEWCFMYLFYLYSRNVDIEKNKINEIMLADSMNGDVLLEEAQGLI